MSLVIASADIDMTGAVPMSSACQIDNNTEPNNHQKKDFIEIVNTNKYLVVYFLYL